MAGVAFQGVTKQFGDHVAVDSLDLEVQDGELLVLLGPSGCGKTTALRMVAGLETPSDGTVRIGAETMNDVDPKNRDVAMVFQSYALYPHLSVARNIEFPLRQRKIPKPDRMERVIKAAATLGLENLLDRKPGQLSGGQRQRVALARAIVRQPKVFLMDEPLSNLDATLRVQTRSDIVALQHQLGVTTLYVTHDQVEAMTMGDRIAVLHDGKLQQVAPPQDLYDRPANRFVASFLGSPGMNLIEVQIENQMVQAVGVALGAAHGTLAPGPLTLGVRPEATTLAPQGLPARVILVEVLGAEVHVICETASHERVVVRQSQYVARPRLGDAVFLEFSLAGANYFNAIDGHRIEA